MRNFYIIGHNPNTLSDAVSYLKNGANALEPDVHYTNGEFYMGEGVISTDLSLVTYLQGLSDTLKTNPELTPALIMFDTKNSDGSIEAMQNHISLHFSAQFPDTVIVITRSQATEEEHSFFLPAAPALAANAAMGIDEYTHPEDVDTFFKSMAVKNYTFADGISVPVRGTALPFIIELFWGRIKHAVELRDKGNSFSMVYAWTLDNPLDIHRFLKLNTDGMITDNPGELKEMLKSYPDQYQLAPLGYNPFA